MIRLGVVGCGLTGAVTAMLLKEKLPHISVAILEKSRGTGGRMCTSRNQLGGGSVDLGAQFITKTSSLSVRQEKCYNELLASGVFKPLQETIEGLRSVASATEHFICPQGSGSVVKHFLKLAECDVFFEHKVTKIMTLDNKLKILCENGSIHEFDAVVLTVPVPQVLLMDGITAFLKDDKLEKLKAVTYCSCLALGLFYKDDSLYFKSLPWIAKFIQDDPILRYISLDHRKRNSSSLPSVVIHTTKEFGKQFYDHDQLTVQNKIMSHIQEILPEMPLPTHVKFHKWKYSQVENSYDSRKTGCLVISEKPALLCGGDGFSQSTFDDCIQSAECIVQKVVMLSKPLVLKH